MLESAGRQYPGLTRFALVVAAFAIGAAGCGQQAAPAATRAPDVPYDPTPHHIVPEMLKLARVGPNDVVYGKAAPTRSAPASPGGSGS